MRIQLLHEALGFPPLSEEQLTQENRNYDRAVHSQNAYARAGRIGKRVVDAGIVTFPNHDRDDVTGEDWEDMYDGADARWEIRQRDLALREVGGEVVTGWSRSTGRMTVSERVMRNCVRSAEVGAEASLTESQWYDLLRRFKESCVYCGLTGVPLQIEHVVSVYESGGATAYNIVPACSRCNRDKWALPLEVFLGLYPARTKGFIGRVLEANGMAPEN